MKNKRLLSALLAATVLASFAGCTGVSSTLTTAPETATKGKSYSEGGTVADSAGSAADRGGSVLEGIVEGEAEYNKSEMKSADVDGAPATDDIAIEPMIPDVGDPGDGDADGNGEVSLPEAGQLTAGEWKDNENWGFFTNLVTSGKIEFPSYGLDPRGRVMITVKDSDGKPAANVNASITDENGKVLWNAVTDYMGRAYLFTSGDAKNVILERGNITESYPLELKTEEIKAPSVSEQDDNGEQGSEQQGGTTGGTAGVTEMELTFGGSGNKYEEAQIMFIVDATGSMSDEMLFLQSEFSAIAREIGTDKTSYSVSFYRDEGDDYVTKCNDFTTDTAKIQKLLNSERADGGGDTPEAVARILDETMNMKSWRDDTIKLAFLIFDAPPHEEDIAQLDAAVAEAAKKGIRLIPVVSSNSDRDTELFGRAIAIMTGGSYVFLTDDSNIGDSHLEPIIGKYDVEKLYDIIIRIINEYRQ